MGNYTISDNVLKSIIEYVASNIKVIYKIQRVKVETAANGVSTYIDVVVEYGCTVKPALADFKNKVKKEIDRLTAMNVINILVSAKGIHVTKK